MWKGKKNYREKRKNLKNLRTQIFREGLGKEELEGETKTKMVQEDLENEAKGRVSFRKKGVEVHLQHILG